MPAQCHYFVKKWNDWIRWYDADFWDYLQGEYDWKRYGIDFGEFHALFNEADYTHLMAQNMVIVLIVLLGLITIWALIVVKDVILSFLPGSSQSWWMKPHSPWC